MSVPRGTTPTFTCKFTDENLDLTEANNVYVTFRSRGIITKSGESLVVRAKEIDVYLTQKETLSFLEGDVRIQANWTGANGQRSASKVVLYPMSEQLLERVVE